jgi:hypothetical protein
MMRIPGPGSSKGIYLPSNGSVIATNPFIDGTATGGVLYWDSTLQTGYANNDPVGLLNNFLPGGTITLSQTLTARPTWKTGIGPNGRPALQFDGVNDQMVFSAEPLPAGNNPASVYAYVSWAANFGRVYNIGGSGGAFDNSHSAVLASATQISQGFTPDTIATVSSPLNKRYALANRYGANSRTGWVRGAESQSVTTAGTNTLTSGSSALGAYAGAGFLNGNIMGFAIYTGVHSDAVATQLLNYWISLFG